MRIAKIVTNLIICFFIIAGIYFKMSEKFSYGYVETPRRYSGGTFQQSPISWYTLFFFAFVFIICRISIAISERKTRKKKRVMDTAPSLTDI